MEKELFRVRFIFDDVVERHSLQSIWRWMGTKHMPLKNAIL